ncbi:hypothetical protein B0H14DRAFT_3497789 [Mycena olivaceomarginata]|nr:hypothetical protein B0H14DRAFT_3497789 [Mycena olivaceomarginata]
MPDGPKSFAVYKPEATAVGAAGAVLPSSPLRLAWFQPSAGGSAAGTAVRCMSLSLHRRRRIFWMTDSSLDTFSGFASGLLRLRPPACSAPLSSPAAFSLCHLPYISPTGSSIISPELATTLKTIITHTGLSLRLSSFFPATMSASVRGVQSSVFLDSAKKHSRCCHCMYCALPEAATGSPAAPDAAVLALANGYGQQPPKSGGWLSICVSDRLIPIAFNGAGTLLAMGSERGTVHLWRVGQPPGDKDKGGGSSAPPSLYNGNGNGGGNAHSLLESMDGNINAGTALRCHSAHLTGAFTRAAAAYLPIPLPPGMGANNNVLGGAGERRCVVGLSSMTPHLMVISSDGYLYAYSIDLEQGGECVLVKQYSCWVPCIDNLWEKCTWEFEFVVPWYLKEISVEDDEPTDASPTLVVCSGELVEQVVHPYSSHKTIFLFSQAVLTSVHHIAYDPNRLLSLPLRFDSSTFLLLIVDLLHAEDAIEQSLETRHTLSHARQVAVQAAAVGDMEAAEAMGMVDMGFGLEVWEKESEQNNWRVEDWTEEDETAMSGATYKWIHMDVDCEWITDLKFDQQDFMWVSQLQRDRDVVAQLEALHALA